MRMSTPFTESPAGQSLTPTSNPTFDSPTVTGALTAASVIASAFSASGGDTHGSKVQILEATELITIAAAANSDSSASLLPANALILGVAWRVTTAIPADATMFDIGIAGALTRFGTGVLVAANTTGFGVNLTVYAAATKIRITPDAAPLAATGRVRVTVYYILLTPPTS